MQISAPEFPLSLQWIPAETPLLLEKLKGHPILLNFWTFCCVDCIHVLPDLKKLEQEFCSQGLVVIGVHSAKFPHEQDYQNILQACHRNNINHPVVVDENMQIWKNYGIRSWPSFVLIDPQGNISFTVSGEGKYDVLREQILKLLENSSLSEVKLSHWGKLEDKLNLRYPTKTIETTIHSERYFFVSDSYNNRIVQLNEEGKFVTSFGEGILNFPQGLCAWKGELLVCDSENNRVVAFELEGNPQRKYRVLAGRGERGHFDGRSEYDAKLAPLNSPADICVWGNNLAISCAGSHQIVIYSTKDDSVVHIAGSGREDILDGAAPLAALAQPTGICALSDTTLIFTDSDTSSLRMISKNWNETGKTVVVTLVGEGLFEFGFENGRGAEAKLQHPLSCCWSPETQNLYVADTYNNAIRIYSMELDFLGTVELSLALNEPSGIVWYENKLIITNCNSHCFFVVNEKEIVKKNEDEFKFTAQVAGVFQGPFGRIADYNDKSPLVNIS